MAGPLTRCPQLPQHQNIPRSCSRKKSGTAQSKDLCSYCTYWAERSIGRRCEKSA